MRTLPLSLLVLSALRLTAFSQGAVFRSGDSFEMRLSGMPQEFSQDFAQMYTVSDDGNVQFPYIGNIHAAGLRPSQLAAAVQNRLIADKIFTTPTAIINLPAASRTVTIGGGVRSPHALPWSEDLTLSSAIMQAGGKTDFGNDKKVKVKREGKATIYNLRKADKDPTQNPKLLPGDEVEVPE